MQHLYFLRTHTRVFHILLYHGNMWRHGELTVSGLLVRSSPDQAVRVRALAGDIVLCSCSHTASLHPGV